MNLDIDKDELLKEFVAESREQLNDIENDLLEIENSGKNFDCNVVNRVFRAAHSIKGASGLFDFRKMQELAHKTETVLDLIRSNVIIPEPEIVSVLLKAFDKLREMVNNVSACENTNISEYVDALIKIASPYAGKKVPSIVLPSVRLPQSSLVKLVDSDFDSVRRNRQYLYFAEYNLISDVDLKGRSLLELVKVFTVFGRLIDVKIDLSCVGTLEQDESETLPMQILYSSDVEPSQIDTILELSADKINLLYEPSSEKPQDKPEISSIPPVTSSVVQTLPSKVEISLVNKSEHVIQKAESTLRVGVDLLENLVNLAGELVLSRNQLREAIAGNDSRGVVSGSQRINLVTTELQEAIMRTRMQPVGGVFGKFPRLVRDLSKELKKDIQLIIEGNDVEMDKTLIEGLSDPLTHMVRNACDHGIENPDVRQKSGKCNSGTIKLRAFHEAGQVIIELSDDGKGIDPEKVALSAFGKGLITQEKLQTMSEKEKMFLIFLPGLSTAEKISDVSGRGVGMDVVKTNLDRLGGKIEIESKIGSGSLFRIKLPLTLAIIPSLIFSVGNERFAVPQIDVIELLCIPVAQVKQRIEIVGDAEVLNLRGKLMPIIHFTEMLGVENCWLDNDTGRFIPSRRRRFSDRRYKRSEGATVVSPETSFPSAESAHVDQRSSGERRYHASGDLNVVVISSGTFQYGLVVDQLFNTEEIVVKPLGRHLKTLREYSGATIMGDGKVALIIDSSGLASKANLTAVSETAVALRANEDVIRGKYKDNHVFLTFHNSDFEDCAVPLELVLRVERISNLQIENVAGRRTMQYRGVSLPLIALSDVAQVEKISPEKELAVIVSGIAGREVGLLAAMPVDVLETHVDIDQTTLQQKGIAGSAIIKNKTYLMVDMYELVQHIYPEWIQKKRPALKFEGTRRPHVLLADDSDFFRKQIRKCMTQEQFEVIEASDGAEAWRLLQELAGTIQLVVTDIEMPEMSGIELAKTIRSDPRFSELPIIALTALSDSENFAIGKAAGINDYQIKLDRDRFLDSIYKHLGATSPPR
ncbi:MAG: chemotaxis protein CheW [Candidatus Riflebacteria bacterium]|nr:chemotaxis protein CheW [Candidatus Riflebacteria bacterium]